LTFLIDNQLPRALARHMRNYGCAAIHVADLGLQTADDRDLRALASANGYVIVSKDEDFFQLAVADPGGPPLIWVRVGNRRTSALCESFDAAWPQIIAALSCGQKIVELC